MSRGYDALDPREADVARSVIAQESEKREHVVVYLSGAHAYGFPSPDSDLDLKCIHVARTDSLLGLRPATPAFDRTETIHGVEIDYTSNELAPALVGMLQGNGNYLERVLGETVLHGSPWLEELRPLAARSLSRRIHRHYRGFAVSQLGEAERAPSAKRVLYVLRTALTGVHALRTGHLVTNLGDLHREWQFDGAADLIDIKRRGERTTLDAATWEAWRSRLVRAFELLDDALAHSTLPETPPNEPEIESWLITVRRQSA